MSTKTLLALTALLLCVYNLDAKRTLGCKCLRWTARPLGMNTIKKIEVFPVSGSCRRTEIRITRKNGRVACADPKMEWVQQMLLEAQRQNMVKFPLSVNQM